MKKKIESREYVIPDHLDYYKGSIYDAFARSAFSHPKNMAYEFMGRKASYREMAEEVELCANALSASGVKSGECVTIALPNCPQALVMFYAINRIGAIVSIIHPLSSERDIDYYLKITDSVMVVTLDMLYDKFVHVIGKTKVRKLVVTGIQDGLSIVKKVGYKVTQGRKAEKIKENEYVDRWHGFLKSGKNFDGGGSAVMDPDGTAVILFSGGTTGNVKGVSLTNMNFNALAMQIKATTPIFTDKDKFIAAMPLFHGFGLGICVHSMIFEGAGIILVPKFTPDSYAKLISKSKCSYFAGVPTLFEGILRAVKTDNLDFSNLKGVFSGGDSLPADLKERFDRFLAEHNSPVGIREGYGATETLAACCLTPMDKTKAKTGSIGVMFPDTYSKIVDMGTKQEVPVGEVGEILVSGPTVMKEYRGNAEETAKVLEKDENGRIWLHTGDLGYVDSDGYLYFKDRAKRMIIASGYNVYPNQIEAVLNECEKVSASCVIGVHDSYRMQRIKAFVVLNNPSDASDAVKKELIAYCKKNVSRYAVPKEIEFRNELPKTKLGKIDFKALEKEEAQADFS